MAWYDDIGNTVGGFFGQQDDELKNALAQTANMKNTQAILTQGADASAQMPGSQASILARENAEIGLSPEESQQQIASSIGTPNVGNVDLSADWDLKGMAKAFLGDESKSDSKKSSAPAPKVIAGKQMDLASLAPQQITNPALKAVQGFGGFSNGGFGQQANAQKQPSLFERMMGIA